MDRWKNQVAIVTGASAGIGAALVEQLVEVGVIVVGLARRKDRLDDLTQKVKNANGKFYGIICDISKEEEILSAFKWIKENLGSVHILVNNAGIVKNTNLIEGGTSMWREVFDINVLGLCMTTREAVKDMRDNGVDGHIIHVNSIFGHRPSLYWPILSVYPASKYAVTALTETLRQELNSIQGNIKISSVSPGFVRTEIRNIGGFTSKEQLELEAALPMLEAKDVADAIVYILSTPPHVQVHDVIIKPIGEE